MQPALNGDLTCDIAVIGGGMGGMAAALRLAERDQDVVLLEAEFCGYGSASRNGGQIAGAPGGDLRMLTLQSPKKMPIMTRLAEHAGRYVEDLMKTHDIDCDYVANGLVPYVAHQLADYIVDGDMPEDLAGIWSDASKYSPSMSLQMQPFVLRAVWGLDRFNDFFNGSKTLARRALRRGRRGNS
ncbi:FAD-dependent oxidoreductase [Kitasatospora sp. NPDC006697]|uniref:FAD-dependent oxidoreductase n=1 Tax=Kitasatospora sp. NPDC006697 TaxID=3364020 RepID=UPI0036A285BB